MGYERPQACKHPVIVLGNLEHGEPVKAPPEVGPLALIPQLAVSQAVPTEPDHDKGVGPLLVAQLHGYRVATRHGTDDGQVTLGGRRLAVRRPRVRSADGAAELAIPSYELFSSTEILGRMALERMMAKLSTRRYGAGLEPVGEAVEAASGAKSKSGVSRRFVAATESALAELMSAQLTDLDLVALMVDGVHFADHLCVVALGIGIDGTKVPLGVVEGSTENATVVTDLLVGLRERGLDVTKPTLVVIDGAKALASAVKAVFDHPVIQRCQLHYVERRIMWTGEATTWQRRCAA